MRVLGVIPARGGSKGIPGKNLRQFYGRPLIWWTISAARKSRLDSVVVSTDDKDIASFCRSCGEYVVDRPPEMATDDAPVIQAVLHALADRHPWKPDAVMLLQPTSPLRTPQDIDAAISLLQHGKADSVCAVHDPRDYHPYRMRMIGTDGYMRPFVDGAPELRRQRLPFIPHRDGSIYLARTEVIESGRFEGDRCLPLVMPAERHCNLDTEWDWKLGEIKAVDVLT